MLCKIYSIREARSTVEKILDRKELIQKYIEIYIVYFKCILYMLTNTNRLLQVSELRLQSDICNGPLRLRVGALSLAISGCLAVESRPVDLGIRRGKGRRDADETSCERGRVDTL